MKIKSPKYGSIAVKLLISIGLVAALITPMQSASAATYTVTYVGNGSTGGAPPVDSTQYNSGDPVTIMGQGTLVRAGYTFGGWENVMIPPSQPGSTFQILGNTSLEPYWIPAPTYTVTYLGNGNSGGTVPVDSTAYLSGATVTVAAPGSMVNAGYTFGGWSNIFLGIVQPGSTFPLPGNISLLAVWTLSCSYTLTYDGNTNTGGTVPVPTVGCGNVTLPGNTGNLVKTGYTFTGWSPNPSGSGGLILPGATFSLGGNATLYAQWTATCNYVLTFSGNGNTSGTPPASIVGCGTVSLPTNSGNMTNSGFTFGGWSSNPNGIGSAQPGDPFSLGGNGTMYAIWIPNCNYTLTFSGNGNTGGTPPAPIVGCGTVILLGNSGNMTNPGFTFGGWSSNPGGIGSAQPGDPFSLGGNGTMYAIWIPNCNYTLTFSGNGNTGGTPPAPIVGCGNVVLSGNTGNMTRPCLTFGGWSSNPNGVGSAQPGDPFTLGNNGTMYAIWTPATFTIHYSGNGSTSGSSPPITVGCGYVHLRSNTGGLIKLPKWFLGWSTIPGVSGVVLAQNSLFNLHANITLYAAWGFKVTYNANGATSGSVPAPTFGRGTATLRFNTGNLQKTGYNLTGWNTFSNPSWGTHFALGSGITPQATTFTLYARWQ